MPGDELSKTYEPKAVEARWLSYWQERGFFNADKDSMKPSFSMVIPPPNVTGSLHMGHALNNTLQDIIARYKRMNGFDVLWLPGMDHAGIATQNVVERMLAKEGLDRHMLGREKFVERVWKWKEESGGRIINQLKRLGASCDWSREQFTMSPQLSRAVTKVFIRLYEEGLLYRDERLINWCPRCLTALSDIEVEHEDVSAKLYYIRYPFKNIPGEFITVATTRPETMLGDTAVAVHPEDKRYNRFAGKSVLLPLTDRSIPVITDEVVDREFGTGAVKITPSHDFNDFEVGKRHGLNRITIFDERAHIKPEIADVAEDVMHNIDGLHVHKAREKVIHMLKQRGFLTKAEDIRHAVGRCYRCRTVVEPYLSPQWFVSMGTLAKEAMEAVERGRTRFIPSGWENTYFEWMRNIKDWCISRQIWWGHRIPAWYCTRCNRDEIVDIRGERRLTAKAKPFVSEAKPYACPICKGKEIIRDSDVLDTWFSSALWPFSTLGWPERTDDLNRYYPTTLLVTGFDIIFFWVARMMMMGLKFMDDVPFYEVYIHALVRDAEGQKMSKSKGNVIDPLLVMDRYGTDAFRFTLAAMASQGRDIRLSEERIEGYRNFCNKIWNLARFTLMNLSGYDRQPATGALKLNVVDKWILIRLNSTIEVVRKAMDSYRFNDAANAIYQFVWHQLCDWYLEMIKVDLRGDNGVERRSVAQNILVKALRDSLKLLHPIMPFITEEIWHAIPKEGEGESVTVSAFPATWEIPFPDAERDMDQIMDIVRTVRNIRMEKNLPKSLPIKLILRVDDERMQRLIMDTAGYISPLARIADIEISTDNEKPENAASAVAGGVELFIPLRGVIKFDDEEKRLKREIGTLLKELGTLEVRLSKRDFLDKAPREVVLMTRKRLNEIVRRKKKLEDNLSGIRKILDR